MVKEGPWLYLFRWLWWIWWVLVMIRIRLKSAYNIAYFLFCLNGFEWFLDFRGFNYWIVEIEEEKQKVMGEEANSWIRRTKFSHTIYYRLDPSRSASFPISIQAERISGLKSRPGTGTASPKQNSQQSLSNQNFQQSFPNQKSLSFPSQKSLVSDNSQMRRNLLTNKQRSLSPLPETNLSDTFKEARSDKKRFSTPHPRRKNQDMGIIGKFLHRESQESKEKSNRSPLRHLASMKVGHEKSRIKESAWAKYFDHGGGKVNAVEAADECIVDMSKLFLGLRFAHGAHSRLYHGLYKDKPVAVKIIRVPDDDENGNLATRLENQFNREVMLLSQLHHPNVIKVIIIGVSLNCVA